MVFVPVARDELIPGLLKGHGDIAAANLTITPERQKNVDFSEPLFTDAKEVVITGPASPPISSIDDLAGKEVYVRKSSSYYESLLELNKSFKKSGKQQVKLIPADENLEDEDLLEMVNAGLIPMIIVDHHKAKFWLKIFDKIQVHDRYRRKIRRGNCLGLPQKQPETEICYQRVCQEEQEGHPHRQHALYEIPAER